MIGEVMQRSYLLAALAKHRAGVLTALIGEVDDTLGLAREGSHLQRLHHQISRHARVKGPAHDLAAIDVNLHRQVGTPAPSGR